MITRPFPAIAVLLALGLLSCSTTQPAKFDPHSPTSATDPDFTNAPPIGTVSSDLLQEPKEPFNLGPGDKLDIEILGETGSRAETFVTPDGKIYFNLLPGLDARGLTTTALKKELETQLTKYYKHPQVSVNLLEVNSQRVWVLGRVNQPGTYPLKRPLRLLDAITAAGGLFASRFTGTTEELADLEHSFVVRQGAMLPINFRKLVREGDMAQNIYLRANDLVYLPSSLTNEVYVMGAVTQTRPVGFMNEMNVVAALSQGLGLQPDADLSRVSIIRGSLTEPKVAVVNAREIMSGKANNVRLQPGDIIFVPGPGQISASSLAREAVNTFVRVVAANEGNNAATEQGGDVGVNLTLGEAPAPAR